MVRAGAPKPFWADAIELEAYVRSNTAHDIFILQGEVPGTVMSGKTSDISQSVNSLSMTGSCSVTSQWHSPMTTRCSVATSVQQLMWAPPSPLKSSRQMERSSTILDKFGPETTPDDFPDLDIPDTPELNNFDDVDYAGWDDEWVKRWHAFTGDGLTSDADDEIPTPSLGVDVKLPTPKAVDNYVNASLMLPCSNSLAHGTVIGRKRDARGNPIGNATANPIMDSRVYCVEFDDGDVCELTANVIAKSMYASCDADGNEYILFDSFVDCKSNSKAVTKDTQRIVHNGRNSLRRSTFGWHLCVQWKDGSTSWQSLKDLKEAYPVAVAEYAVAQGIDDEPAFNWWVHHVLRKREHIITLVKKRSTRFLKKMHKVGIEVPQSVAEAYALDKKKGNTLWADLVAKEMKNVRITFKILANGDKVPIGFQRMRCHMIFDIKMEDLRRKLRLVAGGHMTDAPATTTFASVVSCEFVQIALTLAGLNDLQVKVSDIENAYITAPCTEKIWTIIV